MLLRAYHNPFLVAGVIKAVARFIDSNSIDEAEREAEAAEQIRNGEWAFDEIACAFFNIQVRSGGGDSYPTAKMREIRACGDFRADPPIAADCAMRPLGTYYPSYALGERLGEAVAIILKPEAHDPRAMVTGILDADRNLTTKKLLTLYRSKVASFPDAARRKAFQLSERTLEAMLPDVREALGMKREGQRGPHRDSV
jgi:hypothetical protein